MPQRTPDYLASHRSWEDYSLGRATVAEHLVALDVVYSGIIADHRRALAELADLDPVSENAIADQTEQLEQFQWLVRAYLADSSGRLPHSGEDTEEGAAAAAALPSATRYCRRRRR